MRQRPPPDQPSVVHAGLRGALPPEFHPPAWCFPVPVRAARFLAGDPAFAQFNVEVAQDRIAAFAFAPSDGQEVLYYDRQTQLLGNTRGRHGSGRSGVYRGHYLKGVGRTPAAANWNEAADVYHNSGHLSVGSAIRERTITAFLAARGLGATIVPCRAVLLGRLTAAETRAVRRGESSSRVGFAAADAELLALTVKPADFARMSNFVFALEHFGNSPQALGELFVDLEKFLHPPGARAGLAGSPEGIAQALDEAFRRGLENFRAFARAGLFWLYLDSNFSLDGRFLDLETPLYFGGPFVGAVVSEAEGVNRRDLLGFEEFGFIRHWRVFLAWLRARLRLLARAEVVEHADVRAFLRELSRELARRFSGKCLLHHDDHLIAGATGNLAAALGLERRDRARLRGLARQSFRWWVHGREINLPDLEWRPVTVPPAPATPLARCFEHASFSAPGASLEGRAFADALSALSGERDPQRLLRALDLPTKTGCPGTTAALTLRG